MATESQVGASRRCVPESRILLVLVLTLVLSSCGGDSTISASVLSPLSPSISVIEEIKAPTAGTGEGQTTTWALLQSDTLDPREAIQFTIAELRQSDWSIFASDPETSGGFSAVGVHTEGGTEFAIRVGLADQVCVANPDAPRRICANGDGQLIASLAP